MFERNIGSIEQLFGAFPGISAGIANAYSAEFDGIVLRASSTPTFVAFLESLTDSLGITTGGD